MLIIAIHSSQVDAAKTSVWLLLNDKCLSDGLKTGRLISAIRLVSHTVMTPTCNCSRAGSSCALIPLATVMAVARVLTCDASSAWDERRRQDSATPGTAGGGIMIDWLEPDLHRSRRL